jgi:replicative DNA helicase
VAADHEQRLISRVIRTRDLKPLLDRGIRPDMFGNDEWRDIYEYVLEQWDKYGAVPTAVDIKANWSQARLLAVEDELDMLCDQFMDWRRAQVATRGVQETIAALDSQDVDEAIKRLRKTLGVIDAESVTTSRDIDMVETNPERWKEYQDVKSRPAGLLGLPTGFPTIDKALNGIRWGNLITIVASPKVGKSVLAMKIAANLHEIQNHPTCYLSLEMSNEENKRRYDAMRAGVSLSRIQDGTLTPKEEDQYKAFLRRVKAPAFQSFIMADGVSGMTVPEIAAKIDGLGSKIVVVDGTYMLRDHASDEVGTPRSLTNITRALKQVALTRNIIIIATTQALLHKMKGNSLSQNSIGYTSSFLQDSDLVLGLEQLEQYDPDARNLKILASRYSGNDEVELDWQFEHGVFAERTFGIPVVIP